VGDYIKFAADYKSKPCYKDLAAQIKDAVAEVGSIRLYSDNGYVHLRANGNLELLGDSKHMVRYEELETAYNSVKTTLNELITKYNTHTHPIPTGSSGTTPATQTPNSGDITGAKINEIKTL
jgi:hypothetical protein